CLHSFQKSGLGAPGYWQAFAASAGTRSRRKHPKSCPLYQPLPKRSERRKKHSLLCPTTTKSPLLASKSFSIITISVLAKSTEKWANFFERHCWLTNAHTSCRYMAQSIRGWWIKYRKHSRIILFHQKQKIS